MVRKRVQSALDHPHAHNSSSSGYLLDAISSVSGHLHVIESDHRMSKSVGVHDER